MRTRRLEYAGFAITFAAGAALFGCPKDQPPAPPVTEPDAGTQPPPGPSPAMRAIAGLEFYAVQGCAACHCNSAEGGCNVDAPNLQGLTRDAVDANLRYASTAEEFPDLPDPFDPHPYKTPGASDEDITNLAVFLQTLSGGMKVENDSLIARGYQIYIDGSCISCHLTSAQGVNQGGLGQAIAGIDPDNIYLALAGGVPCHPLQKSLPVDATGTPIPVCSVLGRYVTDNPTVARLTDTAPPDQDVERSYLAYFLAFISPPPTGGFVEPCNAISGQICTVAGNGIGGFTGDEEPATETLLYYPQNLELVDWNNDGSLDLVIVDWNNHRIRVVYIDREVDGVMNGIITIAGDGKVTGTDALNHPTDIAFDRDRNLLISGWHNQNIYRYLNGVPKGTQRDQPAGICDLACSPMDTYMPQQVFDSATARGAALGLPSAIEVLPDGRVIFAENNCGRVRILEITGQPELVQPNNCIDPVRLFSQSRITTIAGKARTYGYAGDGGPARDALFRPFSGPTAPNFTISLEHTANPQRVYIADSMNNMIRYLNLGADPPTVHYFAGKKPAEGMSPGNAGFRDGAAEEALFNFPTALYAHTDGFVYVADTRNHAIRKIDRNGTVTTVAGNGRAGFNGDNIPAGQAQLNSPGGVVVHPDGRIFIADTNNNRIRVVRP